MNLLLTNDDGFEAEGINALAKELSKAHNVFVIAPDRNRSAISHGLSFNKELKVTEIAKNIWSFEGKPADCVIFALHSDFLPVKIDAVLSGVNKGLNIGTDVTFSGTCAAARQGSYYGCPSMAISLDCFQDGTKVDYSPMTSFVSNNLEKLISLIKADKDTHFLNINAFLLPKLNMDCYKGVKFPDNLFVKKYSDRFEITKSETGTTARFIFGEHITKPADFSDEYWCSKGYITISKICVEPQISKIEAEENEFRIKN